MRPITIPPAVRLAIYEHAREAFPAECCGYLAGPREHMHDVARIVRCTNAQATGDNPAAPHRGVETGFVITGRELFELAASVRGESPVRIVYHSHTNGRAYFSDIDRAVAITDGQPTYPVQHLVVGVTSAGVTAVAQFAWSEQARDFVEVARWKPE